MKRELKNQAIREGLIDLFASTKLNQQMLERHAQHLNGMAQTPLDDFFHAVKIAGDDLLTAVTDPGQAGLYVDTQLAISVLLSIGVLRTAQPKLKGAKTDKEREERERAVKAHRDAQRLAREAKVTGYNLEDLHAGLAKVDSPELVRRMLLSPTASTKLATADGKTLDPISLPTRKLNSATQHLVRVSVREVSASGSHAKVKIEWAKEPQAVALKDLFNRTIRLEYRRFKGVSDLSNLLLSLRLASRQVELIVTVTRALRPADKEMDLLVLKELCDLKSLAAEVPKEVQRIQQELWSNVK